MGDRMRKKCKLILTLLLSALLLSSCIQWDPAGEATEGQTTEVETGSPVPPNLPIIGRYLDESYNYVTDEARQNAETVLKTDLSECYLVLANKTHPMGADYVPSDLVRLTCPTPYDEELELEARAAEALYLMLAEMEADGVSGVQVTSAYRSYSYQVGTFNHHVQSEIDYSKNTGSFSTEAYAALGYSYLKTNYLDKQITVLSYADAVKVARSYSAQAGTSEHQTGLCVDLITAETGDTLTRLFEDTLAFQWLSENAYRFGFILRYPDEKEDITGYTYEPWHYRFVGREAATDIHFANLTLEEYLELFEA